MRGLPHVAQKNASSHNTGDTLMPHPNLDQILRVVWTFENGRIGAGRHLSADQDQLDAFFNSAATAPAASSTWI